MYRRFRPAQGGPRADARALGAELDQRLHDLERLLAHRPFFYAERVSMADLAVFDRPAFEKIAAQAKASLGG